MMVVKLSKAWYEKMIGKEAEEAGGPVKRYGKGRKRPRSGVMNKLESSYAEHLEVLKRTGQIVDWWWESVKLRLADNTWLTLDFMVMQNDGMLQLHDTKAMWKTGLHVEDDASAKTKCAAEKYPFPIFYVWKDKTLGWQYRPI